MTPKSYDKMLKPISLLVSLLPIAVFAAEPVAYDATYEGRISKARVEIESTLAPRANGGWVFHRSSEPRGLARAIRRTGVLECVLISSQQGSLRPDAYHYVDGKPGKGKSATIEYDHGEALARSTYQNKRKPLPLTGNATDRLFEEIAIADHLINGSEAFSVNIIERNDRHVARYQKLGDATIKTKAGTFETVIYERRRGTSSRTTRFWYATNQNFLPVKIERLKNGKSQGSVQITRWKKRPRQALGSVTPVCP